MIKLTNFYRIYKKNIENIYTEYLYDSSMESKKLTTLDSIYKLTDKEYDSIEEAEKGLSEYLEKFPNASFIDNEYVFIKCYKVNK